MTADTKYYGKYRGTVVQNIDPEQRGRIQVLVPDVSNVVPSTWATACVPLAGKSMGTYLVPQVGSGVWIEYEQGDADFPIWTGCFWGLAAEVPPLAAAGNPVSPSIVLQTGLQHSIVLSDVPGPTGGIMLKSSTGAMILVNDVGITISNGKGATIVMTGPSVSINNGALTVT
jgi:uncharacterized protein involved in type VI secretion and phage assembly